MTKVFRAAGMAAAVLLLAEVAADGFQRRKKKEQEEITQTLELPPDPPLATAADPSRLAFAAAPLSVRGLLSQQTRDALRVLMQNARGARFVRIRAFVAGTGDLRRVQSIVAETFAEKKQPLPVLTVTQVGLLPLDGAQVQLEATLEQRKATGAGVLFAAVTAETPAAAVEAVEREFQAAETAPDAPVSLLCGVSEAELIEPLRQAAARARPRAAFVVFQRQRIPAAPKVACQASAVISRPVPGGVRRTPASAALSAPKIVFSGAQLAFRYEESDARLAYQRLDRTLQQAGASLKSAAVLNIYPLSEQLAGLAARIRGEFVDSAQPPSGLVMPTEGLPSIDGAFALEAVALPAAGQ
jgi:enamine deaminase RidA (YjgF/YER057c/UK114 family)